MLIVKVENQNIESALKIYKSKVIVTKMLSELNSRKQHQKKSVTKRQQLLKAKYIQKKFGNKN